MEQNILNYITKNGKSLADNINSNIYSTTDTLMCLLLIDYLLDTLKNYDHTKCPDYIEPNIPILPEVSEIFLLSTEDEEYLLTTEDGFVLISEYSNNALDTDYISSEDDNYYIKFESDITKQLFDKKWIESNINKLIKELNCYG